MHRTGPWLARGGVAALVLALAACSRREVAVEAAASVTSCDPAFVAAHPVHNGTVIRGKLGCLDCHATCAEGTKVAFGPLARTGGSTPVWNPTTRVCSGVYCHGATSPSPPGPVAWGYVDPSKPMLPPTACEKCHAYPPPPPHHVASTACAGCHPDTVKPDGTIDVAGGKHVNGAVDVSCAGCHGFPPPTGAHLAHAVMQSRKAAYGDLSILQDRFPDADPASAPTTYGYGCGNCHPLDASRHADGTVQVELADPAAPAGTLKALAAPGAAYDPVSGTCSGVYCHSTGQEVPAYVVTPPWVGGSSAGCVGCHANPPRYLSGGAGAIDANSHLNLADDGYEFGHFLGGPGVWHGSMHGAPGAAPITCQTCHYDTADAANVAPGGFYYLDTTGSYQLPGGDPTRIDSGWTTQLDCTSCHAGGPDAPPKGTGRVRPLRHVNGTRDVVFDPRAALTAGLGLPAPPNAPTRSYWVARGSQGLPWPPTVVWDGTTVSFDFTAARYDRATKTCSGVACHLADVPTWGRPYGYGGPTWPNCNLCHVLFPEP